MKTFKIFMAVAIGALAVMTVEPAFAQELSSREKKEIRNEIRRSEKDLYKKSDRDVRKEARRLKREGWMSMDLPIEKQLERTWERQWERDAEGYEKYIAKSVTVTAQTFNAALRQAEAAAKLGIASDMGTLVQSMAQQSIGNNGISPEQAATVDQHVEKVKLIVNGKLGRVMTSTTLYRQTANTFEVRVTVLYNQAAAIAAAQEAAREVLKEDMKANDAEFDALFGYDKLRVQYAEKEWDEEL